MATWSREVGPAARLTAQELQPRPKWAGTCGKRANTGLYRFYIGGVAGTNCPVSIYIGGVAGTARPVTRTAKANIAIGLLQ